MNKEARNQEIHSVYACLNASCKRHRLTHSSDGLRCPLCGAVTGITSVAEGAETPIFSFQAEDSNEYSTANAAQIHDNALSWLFATFRTTESELRGNLVKKLNLQKGDRVLITGAGAGNDIPFVIAALAGEGQIYAQDFSREMLLWGERRVRDQHSCTGVDLFFSVSDATDLPFESDFFDAAYHFGGINLYSDKKRGISEMYRVVRPGGRVLFGDEGIAPWLRHTEFANILINNTYLYQFEPPLEFIPDTAREVELTWELANSFYVVSLTVDRTPISIDIDVPHLGRRGGSMRTRYFGKLEGIDPAIRDAVYRESERLGISRVELMERIFNSALAERS